MADCRNTISDRGRENYGLDVNRILDSCRDKDCYADTRVYLTDCGQDIIERCSSIRVKDACITGADIDVEPVQFNRGFYSVLIRFYIRITAEAGLCPGRRCGRRTSFSTMITAPCSTPQRMNVQFAPCHMPVSSHTSARLNTSRPFESTRDPPSGKYT